jgi:two-component system, OmpR family, response regulator
LHREFGAAASFALRGEHFCQLFLKNRPPRRSLLFPNIAEARMGAIIGLSRRVDFGTNQTLKATVDSMSKKRESHILVLDDDLEIRNLLGKYLASQDFRVSLAADLKSFRKAVASSTINLAVMDVMLPDGSGLDMCRDLRAQNSTLPIILLTALTEDVDRILGLEFGADDYLGKPFNPRELVARIRAVLRRPQDSSLTLVDNRIYKFADFEVETVRRRITNGNRQEIDLTGAEFDLLHALLSRPGRLLSREQLLDLTGGRNSDPFDRSIDVLMSRIRRKLRDNGGEDVIKTVRNGGYQFTAPVESLGHNRE